MVDTRNRWPRPSKTNDPSNESSLQCDRSSPLEILDVVRGQYRGGIRRECRD